MTKKQISVMKPGVKAAVIETFCWEMLFWKKNEFSMKNCNKNRKWVITVKELAYISMSCNGLWQQSKTNSAINATDGVGSHLSKSENQQASSNT